MKLDVYSLEGKLWPAQIVYLKAETVLANNGPSGQGYGFSSGHVWMWELDCEESWALKNWCFWTVVLEKTLGKSLGLQGDPTNPSWRTSILGIHLKDWCWRWNSNTLATSWEDLTHWRRPWCWEGWGARGEGDDRGRDGWMASQTWWTRVWVNSGSLWWTGRPGMLQFMGSQRVGHGWVTELHWTGEFSGSLGCLIHHSPSKVSGLISDYWIEISQIMSHGIKGNWSKHK